VEADLGPLPVHILEAPYRADKQAFMGLPFWQKEFVGVGPYRVTEFEQKSFMVVQAYDHFHGPKPKIDTITFPFVYDPTVVLANLLAGASDGAIPRAITFAGTKTAERQWQQQGKKPVVLYQPTSWIDIHVRVDPQPTPRELTDVRIRRGLLHALDRQQMVDALWDGEARPTDFFMTETDVKWPWVQDVVVKYPYDPRRARELFAEGGWRSQPDGTLVNAAGEPVTLAAWVTPGGTHTDALPIVADNWKNVGITVDQFVIPRPAMTDPAFQATFRGVYMAGNPLNPFSDTQRKFLSTVCPAAENNWAGNTNRGCYKNPEWDRLSAAMGVAIDANTQRQLWRGMAGIYTSDLPSLPVFFYLDTTIFRDGVSGVKGETTPRSSTTWQIGEWDVQ
jgi:peptide/nickel transport system substrate-binding protein